MSPKKKQKTEPKAAPKKVAGKVEDAAEDVEVKEDKVEDVEMKTEVKTETKDDIEEEKEKDAPHDGRKKLKEPVRFLLADTTPGVVHSTVGDMLLTIKDGGLQYLCSGARSSVGMKSGRYAFEVKIVETLTPADASGARPTVVPKSCFRVGFATAGSSLVLADGDDNICFDEHGTLMQKGWTYSMPAAKTAPPPIAVTDCSIVLVLNLDSKSQNFNTVSVYHDGERVSGPNALPETLKGKALYPTVTWKNATVHTNFSEQASLPYKCRMLGDAAEADAVVTQDTTDQLEVIFPVFLPDKGTFDWIDWFLKENPSRYSELSTRAVHQWADRSGFKNQRKPTAKSSNDKPDGGFAVAPIDDGSVAKAVEKLNALEPRSHIVMEVEGNLVKDKRAKALKKWDFAPYKKVAQVMMGTPEEGYRSMVQEKVLAEKQEKLNKEFAAQQAEKNKKKIAEQKRLQVQRAMQRAEKVRKKMAEAEARKAEAEAKAEALAAARAEAEASGEPLPEEPEEEAKDEAMKEESEDEKMEEEEEEKPVKEEEEEKPPQATLTPVEKKMVFLKHPLSDLSQAVLSASFSKFSIPTEDEGFDEIRFVWSSPEESAEELRAWGSERKLTTRIDDLQPSDWFKEKWQEWQRDLQGWHVKHMEFKDPSKKAGGGTPGPFAKAAPGNHFAKAAPAAPLTGLEGMKEEMKKDEKESQPGDEDKDPMQLLEEELDREDIDIFAVEDVCDMDREGTPLFSNFAFEDWALLSLRFELHLLVHSFRRDAKDPERVGIHPEHLSFYYNKYYKKGLSPKNYGVGSVDDLLELVKDTVLADVRSKVVESMVSDDLETNGVFLKLTEESRRDRARRVDAGEVGAQLKFSRPTGGPGAGNLLAAAPGSGGNAAGNSNNTGTGGLRPAGLLGQRAKAPGQVQQSTPKQQGWVGNAGGFQNTGIRPAFGGIRPGQGINAAMQQRMMNSAWSLGGMLNQFRGQQWGAGSWAP